MSKLIGGRWKASGTTLGSGGQGSVFVVTDVSEQLPGQWAAKVLLNAKRADRIEREVYTAKQLHAAGAPVLQIVDDYLSGDAGTTKPWFVTPIAPNGNLAKHIDIDQPYGGSTKSAIGMFRKIASAVLQLHKSKVAHRDLKPDNILLDGVTPLLADLGLCLPLDDLEGDRLTGALERIGSIHFLPPEAFGRQPLDQNQFAFDAYALGKIFYQLVSGNLLPGFVSPTYADYNLAKKENSIPMRAINRSLVGLLHDTPVVRIATLNQIEEQLDDLVGSLESEQQHPRANTTILLRFADAVATHIARTIASPHWSKGCLPRKPLCSSVTPTPIA